MSRIPAGSSGRSSRRCTGRTRAAAEGVAAEAACGDAREAGADKAPCMEPCDGPGAPAGDITGGTASDPSGRAAGETAPAMTGGTRDEAPGASFGPAESPDFAEAVAVTAAADAPGAATGGQGAGMPPAAEEQAGPDDMRRFVRATLRARLAVMGVAFDSGADEETLARMVRVAEQRQERRRSAQGREGGDGQ